MGRFLTWCSLLTVVVLALSGCTSGARASDPAAAAVRDAHSAVASLVLSVRLMVDGEATTALTQVSLEQCLTDVAGAQQELLTATDADPRRRAVANAAVRTAADTLLALDNRGAGELGASDLARLEQVEQVLAAAARELQA